MDDWIVAIFWSKLASICGMDSHDIMQKTIDAGHTCICFFNYRVIAAAQDYPWRLALGDVTDNLRKLMAEDEPSEPATRKIWLQLRAGLPMNIIERQVCLLRDVCWSSLPAEQLHGTAAGIRRHHPEYTVNTLMARSSVMAANQLVPKISDDARKIEKLQNKLDVLKRKCPTKSGGRQMYVKELHEAANEQLKSSGQPRPANFTTRIMESHVAAYNGKSFQARCFFERRAKAVALRAQAGNEEEMERLRADILLLKVRTAEAARQRPPLVPRDFLWNNVELASFAEQMADPSYSATAVAPMRADLVAAPPPIQYVTIGADVRGEAQVARAPTWLSAVCNRRKYFEQTALIWEHGAERHVVKFLFASRSPAYVGVSPIVDITFDFNADAATPTIIDWSALASASWRSVFAVDFSAHCSLAKVASVDEATVSVLPHLVHVGGNVWASDAKAVRLRTYNNRFPAETMHEGPPQGKKPRTKDKSCLDEALKAHPWLNSTLGSGSKLAGAAGPACMWTHRRHHREAATRRPTPCWRSSSLSWKLHNPRWKLPSPWTMVISQWSCLTALRLLVRGGSSYQGVVRGGVSEDWCRQRGCDYPHHSW